ncbi:hypothetical protein ACE1ET_08970 [Saccharicrinis sp. FJH62]|uniref:hypothetical protein n=1 Tax=Saccharicrinis sp. FJH62 TaxID=3344657 RepID=UPI0035D46057
MNNRLTYIVFFVIQFLVAASGQNKPDRNVLTEEYVFSIDRTVYVAGEDIFFSAYNLQQHSISSTVFYVDIVTEEGTAVSKACYFINSGKTSGKVRLPADLPDGIYKVRGYTRVMRNFGLNSFNTVIINVINPTYKNSKYFYSDSNVVKNMGGILFHDSILTHTRSEVRLSVKSKHRFNKILSISVVPEVSLTAGTFSQSNLISGDSFSISPELRGQMVSGKVDMNSVSSQSYDIRMYYSSPGSYPVFLISRIDSLGQFCFELPPGLGKQIYIVNSDLQYLSFKVLAEYETEGNSFSVHKTMIENEKILELYKKMMLNAQIANRFVEKHEEEKSRSFYGKPEIIIDTDDFIELPSVTEYINELSTHVLIQSQSDTKKFLILDGLKKIVDRSYSPLVLVDDIYYSNINNILEINPLLLDRFEIIDRKFIVGDYTFSGLINIKSDDRNLAGLKLQKNAVTGTIEYCQQPFYGKWISDSDINSVKPLVQNCIYWNTDISLNEDVRFNTGDIKTNYVIKICGLDSNNKPLIQYQRLIVN